MSALPNHIQDIFDGKEPIFQIVTDESHYCIFYDGRTTGFKGQIKSAFNGYPTFLRMLALSDFQLDTQYLQQSNSIRQSAVRDTVHPNADEVSQRTFEPPLE